MASIEVGNRSSFDGSTLGIQRTDLLQELAQIPFTVSLNLLAITNDHDNYDYYMRTKPKTGKWALPIDLISKRISYHLPKGKFILHNTLFNMAAGIQIKFHQDTVTHILKKILNVILKRSVVSPYLKPDKNVRHYITISL